MKTEYVNILCENLLDIRDNFKTKIECCLMIFTLIFKAKIFNKGIKVAHRCVRFRNHSKRRSFSSLSPDTSEKLVMFLPIPCEVVVLEFNFIAVVGSILTMLLNLLSFIVVKVFLFCNVTKNPKNANKVQCMIRLREACRKQKSFIWKFLIIVYRCLFLSHCYISIKMIL